MLKTIMVFFAAFLVNSSLYAAEFFCAAGDVTCLIVAINQANSTPAEDTIHLQSGIYTLTVADNDGADGPNALPLITGRVTIRGAAAESTFIERDPAAPPFRLAHVAANGNLTVDALSLRGGVALGFVDTQGNLKSGLGGAVLNRGTLAITDSILTNNSVGGEFTGSGGAIYSQGTTTITKSTLTANFADANRGGTGGAIYSQGTLTIIESAIINNFALGIVGQGGAIHNQGTPATVVNTTIAGNSASGPVFGGAGGGISNAGTLTILNSTIVCNSALGGGAIFGGGGLSNSGATTVQNTILALNANANEPDDCSGPVTSLDHNLIGDPTGCAITLGPNDLSGDPGLGDLTDDGSPGNGHFPLLANSQARDRGNPAACPLTDQLGLPRSGICDIGSIEFQGRTLVSIDIRPHSDRDRVNPRSRGWIRVAILTTDSFDASTVMPKTVRFGLSGTEAASQNFRLRDVDRDGDDDMILRFEIHATGVKCGATSLSLTGQTSSGIPIVGSSPIDTIGCMKKK